MSAKQEMTNSLLTAVRRRDTRVKGRTLLEEADADRARVLFSAPFRRLQNKAQVFSLEPNAAVRSRLTHSLEVASIGRLVVAEALSGLTDEQSKELGFQGNDSAISTFVETACLVHDLGNPPFGHFGERAISDWFHAKSVDITPKNIGGEVQQLWEKNFRDFLKFDGNPQGFRILSKLQIDKPKKEEQHGMNLTATTLAAMVKYPWAPNQVDGAERKKAGYFHSEEDVMKWVRNSTGIKEYSRHPLIYFMEAADDIAYCVSDIEDGIEKGLVSATRFAEFMESEIEEHGLLSGLAEEDSDDKEEIECSLEEMLTSRPTKPSSEITSFNPLKPFRSALIRLLCRRAGRVFRSSLSDIRSGKQFSLLDDGDKPTLLKSVKKFAVWRLYGSEVVRNREITAQAVLSGLLDVYKPLMTCEEDRFKDVLKGKHWDGGRRPIARESSLMSRVSQKYLSVYRNSISSDASASDPGMRRVIERAHRIHLILDYITGMTDEYALQSYRLISGMSVSPFRA